MPSVGFLSKLVHHQSPSQGSGGAGGAAAAATELDQQGRLSVAVACASGNSTPRPAGTPLGVAVAHEDGSSSGSRDGGGGGSEEGGMGPGGFRSTGVRFAGDGGVRGLPLNGGPGGRGLNGYEGSLSERSRLL